MSSEDLFQIEPPPVFVDRIHAFARLLVLGVIHNYWEAKIYLIGSHGVVWCSKQEAISKNIGSNKNDKLIEIQRSTWLNMVPNRDMLEIFGYIEYISLLSTHNVAQYRLTEKAFALLSSQPEGNSVFISYRRQDSTSFALLIEARLRLAGNNNVFVDKLLEIGGAWREELEERIEHSKYMIVLIGHTTFESEWVRREIDLAQAHNCTIIPIWQANVERSKEIPDIINERQEIRVERDSAEGYETAISKLLNRLGYATY